MIKIITFLLGILTFGCSASPLKTELRKPAYNVNNLSFLWNLQALEGRSFGFFSDESFRPSAEQIQVINSNLRFISQKYPRMMNKIFDKGYSRIIFSKGKLGENGGAILAEVHPDIKTMFVYESYFTASSNTDLKNLPYSISQVSLLHEFIHAFDDNNEIVSSNIARIGWGLVETVGSNGFKLASVPQLQNIWISENEVNSIKNSLTPMMNSLGPWAVYVQARNRVKRFGYPTLYSILGGPVESFAELGAYIGLDPTVPQYILPETIKWYQDVVLQ